jgi:hypothetical protein
MTHTRHIIDRRGRTPLMRFCPLQHTLAVRRVEPGRMPAVPDNPASAFSPSARALLCSAEPKVRWRPPVRSSAAAGVRRCRCCGGRVRGFLCSRGCCFSLATAERELLYELPASAITGAGVDLCFDRRAHRLPDHISRRRLAPAWIRPGHSSLPFLARDVPDPRFPILRDLAGRLGSSLFPSGGAHGVAPFAGLLPVSGGRAAQARRLNGE